MHNPRETTCAAEQPGPDRAIPTILRGEEVLDEARVISQKISDRVARAVTERPTPPSGRAADQQ